MTEPEAPPSQAPPSQAPSSSPAAPAAPPYPAGCPVPVNSWRTLGSRVMYANPWITVREDDVIRPDGKPGVYGVVEMRPSVGIVALNDAGQIALVSQWRYPLGKPSLEIPTGGCEDGEPPLDAARRELAEETGLTAGSWGRLGTVDQSNGVTTDVAHVFLARALDALPGPARGDGKRGQGEEGITVVWLPFGRAVELARSGEITEAVSVAGLLRVALGEWAPGEWAQGERAPGEREPRGRLDRAGA